MTPKVEALGGMVAAMPSMEGTRALVEPISRRTSRNQGGLRLLSMAKAAAVRSVLGSLQSTNKIETGLKATKTAEKRLVLATTGTKPLTTALIRTMQMGSTTSTLRLTMGKRPKKGIKNQQIPLNSNNLKTTLKNVPKFLFRILLSL